MLNRRSKNWNCIFYPESLPDDWKEQLLASQTECIISPLHDLDLNADGEPKKAHYHLIIMFGGLKSFQQVVDFLKPFNCPIPQINQNIKASVRYMAHLDNPEKVQYNPGDIEAFGGVDLATILQPSASEKNRILEEVLEFVDSHGITEFKDLVDYARKEKTQEWFPIVANGYTIFLNSYIKSARHSRFKHTDSATGEITE